MIKPDKHTVLEFLKNNPIMNIAVVDDAKVMASVVLFSIDDTFTIYFATHASSFKAKALLKHPQMSLSVWKAAEMLVQADGHASIAVEKDVDTILGELANSSIKIENFWPPIFKTEDDFYSVFKIKLHWLRALDLSSFTLNERDNPFVEIEL